MVRGVKSSEKRVEYDAKGVPLIVTHSTDAALTAGLGTAVEVDGAPLAVTGSSGPTRTDHRMPNLGQVIVPMPLTCTVRSGCDWFLVDDEAVALPSSRVQVPDAFRPVKKDVLEADNDFFFVGDEPAVQGG